MLLKIADRKLCFGLFCHSFADPSHKLRASAQGFGSGHCLTPLFRHSDPERSEGEESPQETLRLRLRVTEKGHSFTSVQGQGDRKGSFLRFCSGQRLPLLFCHSERSVSGVKNLILFRVRISEESPQETLWLRTALRGRAPQKVNDFLGTPRLAPQNDGMGSRHLFSIGNFRCFINIAQIFSEYFIITLCLHNIRHLYGMARKEI